MDSADTAGARHAHAAHSAHAYPVGHQPKLVAMLDNRCPRCRKGKVFKYPALDYVHFRKINENCPNCGLHFEPEPGFYQLAMYTSYANSVALLVVCFFAVYLLLDNPNEWVYIGITIGLGILLAPLNFRFSRLMVLHLFAGHKYTGGK